VYFLTLSLQVLHFLNQRYIDVFLIGGSSKGIFVRLLIPLSGAVLGNGFFVN
jgi:hypothetical protein